MKIKTKSGKVIDLDSRGEENNTKETPKSRIEQSEDRISKRETIQEEIGKNVRGALDEDAPIGKRALSATAAGLNVIGAPFNAVESALANKALEIQKGNYNPLSIGKKIIEGATLQRRGQYGDVFKNAGIDPLLSDTAGFVLAVSPVAVWRQVSKALGNISRMSDKGLMKAGNKVLQASSEAKNAVGAKVTQEYAQVDDLGINGTKFLDSISDLPQVVLNKAKKIYGDLDDYAQGMNIGKLREFKRLIGKLKPNSFSKSEKGLADTIDDIDVNKAYSKLQGLLKETLFDKSFGIGKAKAEHLFELDRSYGQVIDAVRYVRKTITSKDLKLPTQVGKLAKNITSDMDSTARVALSTIKSTTNKARGLVNETVNLLEKFNRGQRLKTVAEKAGGAVVFGGAAGAIGGRILQNIADRK